MYPKKRFQTYTGNWTGSALTVAIRVIGLCFFIVLLIALLKPKPDTLTVQDIQWQCSVKVEELKTYEESGWNIPPDARVVDERTAVIMCGKTPIFRTKYYYEIDRWTTCRTVDTEGYDHTPVYGELNLQPGERKGSESCRYIITARNTVGEIKNYTMNEEDWLLTSPGDILRVKVMLGGSIKVQERVPVVSDTAEDNLPNMIGRYPGNIERIFPLNLEKEFPMQKDKDELLQFEQFTDFQKYLPFANDNNFLRNK